MFCVVIILGTNHVTGDKLSVYFGEQRYSKEGVTQ